MVAAGTAEYDPPKASSKVIPTGFLIYWRRPEEWATLIYDWVRHGRSAGEMSLASTDEDVPIDQGERPHEQHHDLLRAHRRRRPSAHDRCVPTDSAGAGHQAHPAALEVTLTFSEPALHRRVLPATGTVPPPRAGRACQGRQGAGVQRPRRGRRWSQIRIGHSIGARGIQASGSIPRLASRRGPTACGDASRDMEAARGCL